MIKIKKPNERSEYFEKFWHLKKNQKEQLEIKNYSYWNLKNWVGLLKNGLDIVEEILS